MVKKLDPSKCTVIVIGAGTWGASTALHLVRRGYKSVAVFDPYEVPSPIAAGNDINKIVEEGMYPDSNKVYTDRLTGARPLAQIRESRRHSR